MLQTQFFRHSKPFVSNKYTQIELCFLSWKLTYPLSHSLISVLFPLMLKMVLLAVKVNNKLIEIKFILQLLCYVHYYISYSLGLLAWFHINEFTLINSWLIHQYPKKLLLRGKRKP